MDLLLKAQTNQEEMADDDPQMSYLISAWARICKIMGKRFEPYLPLVMGPVLKTASLKPEVRGDLEERILSLLKFYIKMNAQWIKSLSNIKWV